MRFGGKQCSEIMLAHIVGRFISYYTDFDLLLEKVNNTGGDQDGTYTSYLDTCHDGLGIVERARW